MAKPIRKLLIANRGEIAIRIIGAARQMGIRTVAVFSDADETAFHVACADHAIRIGPPPARESYMNIDAVVAAARASGADAVHPGYGFLAESADFAEACLANDLVFVGPPAQAIRAMGDKARARALMADGVARVVPGYHGADQSLAALSASAASIGFPLLIKASAGGGGRGMRVVEESENFPDALQGVRREAASAFGDDRVILERYMSNARHIEVQVFADSIGQVVHMYDRDCSAQRRRQKLVEEAPAQALSDTLRDGMRQAAVACARAVSYVGAGTVEFLVAEEQFYFMEMNTRLQVEHPVTEAVTGLDLVEWQIRVARGEPLPLGQHELRAAGHAIEARIYAENADKGFIPQVGRITHLRWPQGMGGVRIESGVRQGDEASPYYDSLLGKIIAHGADRREALDRLAMALSETVIAGVPTNRSLLARLVADADFVGGSYDTNFVEARLAQLTRAEPTPSRTVLSVATIVALHLMQRAAARPVEPSDPFSPWNDLGGWRLGARASVNVRLVYCGREIDVQARWRPEGYELTTNSENSLVSGAFDERGILAVRVGDERVQGVVAMEVGRFTLFLDGAEFTFSIVDPRQPPDTRDDTGGRLASPTPGRVIAVLAETGSAVERGAPLVIIEAMKMEHTVHAPRAGRIAAIHVRVGDQVSAGAELAVMEAKP